MSAGNGPGRWTPGAEAVAIKGWWPAHQWLILRRASQLFFLALFLAGPLAGVWIVKGTLASSLTLDVLPLTDPLIALQSLVAGHLPETSALIGLAIVAITYAIIGGRVYCAWVCPVNPLTDAAHWLRQRMAVDKGWQPAQTTRYWVLGMVLAVSAVTGTIAWELLNPVTILHRGLVFGTLMAGMGWTVLAAVFLFDVFVSRRGWCSHICPVGAFYGLIGSFSLVRVSARRRAACNDCMDCFAVCPEAHVITPALKGEARGLGPVVLSRDCTNCGRCIDVCSKDVFTFAWRFDGTRAAGQGCDGAEGTRQAA
jgi:ferredoxin-type protein NapH